MLWPLSWFSDNWQVSHETAYCEIQFIMHEFRSGGGARIRLTRWSPKEAGALRATGPLRVRGLSSQRCPRASPGRWVPWVQGSAIRSLASWRHVCSSAAAGAEAGSLVPWFEDCLCPGLAPITSPRGEFGEERRGLDLEVLRAFWMPAESVFFPLRTDVALAHTQGCKQHTDAWASPSISCPLYSLGSDSSHPPGTSLILTSPPSALSPNS